MSNYNLPANSLYGDQPIPLSFPENWDVHISKIAGYDTPALSTEQIAGRVHAAIGTAPISEGARGCKSAVTVSYTHLTLPTNREV